MVGVKIKTLGLGVRERDRHLIFVFRIIILFLQRIFFHLLLLRFFKLSDLLFKTRKITALFGNKVFRDREVYEQKKNTSRQNEHAIALAPVECKIIADEISHWGLFAPGAGACALRVI